MSDAKNEVAAAEFKAKCLAILDEVADSGREIVITKRGKPVAKLSPIEPPKSLVGSVKILCSDEELFSPFGDEEWDADWENFRK
jgi:prevent-host-death family protein